MTEQRLILLTEGAERRRRFATARAAADSRQRTLAQLYNRRAAVEDLIRSLEDYGRRVEMQGCKVVCLR